MYNPTEPVVGPDAGLHGGEPVTIRKFAEARQSQEIISAMELIEVSFQIKQIRKIIIKHFTHFDIHYIKSWILQESDNKIIGNGKSNKKGSKSKSSEKSLDAKSLEEKQAVTLVGPGADGLELVGPPADGLEWQKGRREERIDLPPPLAPPYHHHRC